MSNASRVLKHLDSAGRWHVKHAKELQPLNMSQFMPDDLHVRSRVRVNQRGRSLFLNVDVMKVLHIVCNGVQWILNEFHKGRYFSRLEKKYLEENATAWTRGCLGCQTASNEGISISSHVSVEAFDYGGDDLLRN